MARVFNNPVSVNSPLIVANSSSATAAVVVSNNNVSLTSTGLTAVHSGLSAVSYDTISGFSSTAGLYIGQSVTLSGFSNSNFNGPSTIQLVGSNNIRVDTLNSTNGSGTGGTVTATGSIQNLQEWQKPDGTLAVAISSGGTITTPLTAGVVHANGSGTALTSSLIVDADISSSAAISTSKISGLIPQVPPTGTWIGAGNRTSLAGDQTNINGTLRIVPFWITTARTLDAVAVLIGTGGTGSAGALGRVGIWNADANGAPSTLVRDCSTVALTGTAGTVAQISSLAQSLPAGGYWIGAVIQGAPSPNLPYMVTSNTPIFSPYSYSFQATSTTAAATDFLGNNTYRATGVTGAFASTVPSFTYNSDNTSPIKVIWKFSA
jgi:hypothetical protein